MAIVAGLAMAPNASGQDKPPPTPINMNDQIPTVNVAGWRAANKRLSRPKWIVLAGLAAPVHQGQGDPGSTLFNLDQTGITQQLRSSLQEALNPPEADVRFVQFDALKSSINRLKGTLDTRREREAIKLLADDLSVRRALIVRIHTFAGGDPEKVTVESMDMATGDTEFNLTFDWKLGTSARDIKDYAKGLAARFADDFIARTDSREVRVDVRVFGLESPEDIRTVRRAFNSVRGVEEVDRGSGAAGHADSFVTYTVTLEKGNTETDIGEELPIALQDVLKRKVEVVKDEGGGMALRVLGEARAAREEPRECVELLLDRDNPRGKKFMDDLRATYKAQEEPTIAVMVNRRPVTKREIEQAGGAGVSAGAVVVVQNGMNSIDNSPISGSNSGGNGGGKTGTSSPAPGSTEEEFRTISALNTINQTVEGLIYKRLGPDGTDFRRLDGVTLRQRMQQGVDFSKGFTDEVALLRFLQDSNIAQLVIHGTGTLTIDGGYITARYEFRLVGRDSTLFAAAPQVLGRVLIDGPITTSAELERMADEAVAQLMCEYTRSGRGRAATPKP